MKGAYILVIHLKKNSKIRVGKLGTISFEKGYYCYVGSAKGGSVSIESRTNRHKRLASKKVGKLKWHIDYFLADPNVSIIDIKKLENNDECKISKILENSADSTIHKFGSSDCKCDCVGHLHFFKNKNDCIKVVNGLEGREEDRKQVAKIEVKPIGVIHSPFKNTKDVPIQSFRSNKIGKIEVFKRFESGLKDIEGFSHIMILYFFHKAKNEKLLVKPYLDKNLHGIFATRYPNRPNRIGISILKLLDRRGNVLVVDGIDVIDGTPLLDIKPYVSKFDVRKNVKDGWLTKKLRN